MARLPGPDDVGQVNPGSGERPIGQIDAQPLARGLERFGAGVGQLGAGVENLGIDMARSQVGLAHAGATAELMDLKQTALHDTNYGPDANGDDLVARYQKGAAAIRDKWAGSIDAPGFQQQFVDRLQPQISEGVGQLRGHAFTLEGNHQIAATDQIGQTLQNKAAAVDDPSAHAQAMDAYGAAVDGLVGRGFIGEDQGLLRKQRFAAGLGEALLSQQADPNGGNDPLGAANHVRVAPGSDAELTERIIQIESGGNPNALASGSSAAGLGQFTNDTWLGLIKSQHPELAKGRSDSDLLALRADPTLSREMTDALIGQNRSALQAQGLDPTAGNLYLSHFLGAGDAARVLKADPNTPVAALLDPKVIAANPSILGGRTAGSIAQWSNNKMGGYAPGEGSIYSYIPPERRAALSGQFMHMAQAQQVGNRAQLAADQQDAEAEALDTGSVTNPIPQERFVAQYGADEGSRRFQQYDTTVQTGRTIAGLAAMTPDQRQATVESLAPTAGEPGYAIKAQAYDAAQKALARLQHEQSTDPAQFAVQRLPAVQQAWSTFSSVLPDPQSSDDDKRAAARDFALRTTMEQQRVGVAPDDVRILPQSYVDSFSKAVATAADSDSPQARIGLVAQVQKEATMWGDAWPQVMRQIAPQTQPMVRAIAAGADPTAMTRLLSLDPKEKQADILKQQDVVKSTNLNNAVDGAMAPFRSSMVGRQLDRDYPGYYGLAKELGALYVRDGDEAPTAAARAFNALVGDRYEFRDTWRMPKGAGVSADDVQAGTVAARDQIAAGGLNIKPAIDDLGLGDQLNRTDSFTHFARDGRFVTAPGNDGLNLVYDGRRDVDGVPSGSSVIRTADGKPLLLTWQQLAELGGTPAARASQSRGGEAISQAATKRSNAGVRMSDEIEAFFDDWRGRARALGFPGAENLVDQLEANFHVMYDESGGHAELIEEVDALLAIIRRGRPFEEKLADFKRLLHTLGAKRLRR